MHSNFCIFKFRVYLTVCTRLFTKLNLFEILLYGILKFPDLQYIYKIDIMQENMLHAYSGLPV